MAELFDIVGGDVVLNPQSLYIKPFRDIWKRDKDPNKEQATNEISYVVFLLHNLSPYNSYPEEIRDTMVKKDVFGDIDYHIDTVVEEALDKYAEFQNTTNTRLLDSAKKAAEELSNYFRSVNFSMLDERGKPMYSARELASNLSAVGNIIKSLSALEKQVRREQLEDTKVKGQTEIGDYEIPKKISGKK